MTRYALQNHSAPMFFVGTVTQAAACTSQSCQHGTPYATDNSPGTGWGQLMQFLNFDSSVYQNIGWSSDFTW